MSYDDCTVQEEFYLDWRNENIEDLKDSFCHLKATDFDKFCRDEFKVALNEMRYR